MDLSTLIDNFDFTTSIFPTNHYRKNYFLAACFTIDFKVDLDVANEKCPYGGLIGIGKSRLDNYLRRYKIFRLHAILHDAAGFMKRYSDSGPGYCYACPYVKINSCFLGHVSGIIYCLYLKYFNSFYEKVEC